MDLSAALRYPQCKTLIHQRPLVEGTGYLCSPWGKVWLEILLGKDLDRSCERLLFLKNKQKITRDCLLTCFLSAVLKVIKMVTVEWPSFASVSLQTSRNAAWNHRTNLTPANDQERIAHRKRLLTRQYLDELCRDHAGMCILERFTSHSFTTYLKCSYCRPPASTWGSGAYTLVFFYYYYYSTIFVEGKR